LYLQPLAEDFESRGYGRRELPNENFMRRWTAHGDLSTYPALLGTLRHKSRFATRHTSSAAPVKTLQPSSSNVVAFRARIAGRRHARHKAPSDSKIDSLIDLSRYEVKPAENFRVKMATNVAVLVVLVGLAAATAADVVNIEIVESCAPAWQCGH
jgi:hypothetical protein